jgi:lysophospholipase L1-like esterase
LGEVAVRVHYGLFASEASRRGFSVFADEPGARFVSHPYLGYALTPDWVDPSRKTHHDASGFRGPSPDSRPDRILIATLGGSSTYGTGIVEDEATYPAVLGTRLRETRKDDRIQVLNAGVPGYTSFESFTSLAFRVLDQRPRVLVVYEGANDLHARRANPYLSDNSGYRHAWREPERWRLGLLRHSHLARWAGFRVGLKPLSVEEYTRSEPDLSHEPPLALLHDNPPHQFRRNLENIVRLARSRGALVVLCSVAQNPDVPDHYARFAYYREGIREMNEIVRDVARKEAALFADVDAGLSRDRGLWLDGVHLNAPGARAHAEIVQKVLESSDAWQKP